MGYKQQQTLSSRLRVESGTTVNPSSRDFPQKLHREPLGNVSVVSPQRFSASGRHIATRGVPISGVASSEATPRGTTPIADSDQYSPDGRTDFINEFVSETGSNYVSASDSHMLSMMDAAIEAGDYAFADECYDAIANNY